MQKKLNKNFKSAVLFISCFTLVLFGTVYFSKVDQNTMTGNSSQTVQTYLDYAKEVIDTRQHEPEKKDPGLSPNALNQKVSHVIKNIVS